VRSIHSDTNGAVTASIAAATLETAFSDAGSIEVYYRSSTATADHRLVELYIDAGRKLGIYLDSATGKVTLYQTAILEAGTATAVSAARHDDGKWTKVVAAWSATQLSLTVNAETPVTTSITGVFDANSTAGVIYVGKGPTAGLNLPGEIAKVEIKDQADAVFETWENTSASTTEPGTTYDLTYGAISYALAPAISGLAAGGLPLSHTAGQLPPGITLNRDSKSMPRMSRAANTTEEVGDAKVDPDWADDDGSARGPLVTAKTEVTGSDATNLAAYLNH